MSVFKGMLNKLKSTFRDDGTWMECNLVTEECQCDNASITSSALSTFSSALGQPSSQNPDFIESDDDNLTFPPLYPKVPSYNNINALDQEGSDKSTFASSDASEPLLTRLERQEKLKW